MTFYLGMARPEMAFLACDTRVRVPGLGVMLDGSLGSKLHALRGGWATGSGCWQWIDLARQALRQVEAFELEAVSGALRALSTSQAVRDLQLLGGYREAMARQPADRGDHLTSDLAIVYHAPGGGFGLATFDDEGRCTQPPNGLHGRVLNTVRELDTPATWDLIAPATEPPASFPHDLVRRIAYAFARLFEACGAEGSLSDEVEIVAMARAADGPVATYCVGPIRSAVLAGLSDAQLGSCIGAVP